MTSVVKFSDVTKRYGRLVALEHVSLDLAPGEAVALVGHNGAGKTTLMKLALGLIRPTSGEITVLGRAPAGSNGAATRRRLGFLPESVAFHAAMSGRELLAFYARLKGAPVKEVGATLERVGLAEAAGRRIGTYSKGMRQRLGLAQALLGEPELLLLDEPTSGLDPDSRAQMYATIDALRRDGTSVLVSTHALAEIERHVDRVALVHHGRLLTVGTLAALRAEAGLPLTSRLTVKTCTTDKALAALDGCARPIARDPRHLVLAVEPAEKLVFLTKLERLSPWLEDVEIDSPGLEAVYRHLVANKRQQP